MEHFIDCCLIIGKVDHRYTLTSSSLQPWVIIKSTGTVVCGHRTCMAGLGETCSHVGALLYCQVRRYSDTSSASKTNLWIEPHIVKHVPYLRLEEINFTSAEQTLKDYKQPLQQSSKPMSSKLVEHSKPTCAKCLYTQ